MASTVKESNNVIYVEPNYNGAVDGHEVAPQLEDYSIFINLEVEIKGRNIRSRASSDDDKIILSWVSNGASTNNNTVNLMQGSKIPLSDGKSMYSLTTNYTDVFIKDLKKVGGNSEMFGISSVDIAYNNYMVPEVTIQFVDVRGAALFSPKESSVTNNGHDMSVSNTDDVDIANTFFQCFFTFPYPKFSLIVKGFYGEPVSYELTCADFRATFDSSTGNFNCTAKFVGYAFSFLNDVMVNYMIAAPYSDYIGSDYWKSRGFTLNGISGEDVPMPTIIELIKNFEAIKAGSLSETKNDDVIEEKNAIESERNELTTLKDAYNEYARQLSKHMSKMKSVNNEKEEMTLLFDRWVNFDGNIKNAVLLSNRENEKLGDYVGDFAGEINGAYRTFKQHLDNYNRNYPNKKLPEPKNVSSIVPYKGITRLKGDDAMFNGGVNTEIFKKDSFLYNDVKNAVEGANGVDKINPYIAKSMILVYYYTDNGFNDIIEERQRDVAAKEVSMSEEIKAYDEDELTRGLGFKPSVENITKILMAHFETFCHMIYKTGEIIGSEDPKRTMRSLGISDPDDLTDVPSEYKEAVPPFPKVTKLVYRQGNKNREETWVGAYNADFREKDLVHGILNGVAETKRVMSTLEEYVKGLSGSTNIETLDILYPMTPYDLTSSKKIYGSVDKNDLSNVMSLAVLRALGIFCASGVLSAKDYSYEIGRVEALNFMNEIDLTDEMKGKISSLSVDQVFDMLNGLDNSNSIPKQGLWPWQSDASDSIREKFLTKETIVNGTTITSQSSAGAVTSYTSNGGTTLYADIFYAGKNQFKEYDRLVLPLNELSWERVRDELYKDGASALLSNDYVITRDYDAIDKNNYFIVETNHRKFSSIINNQLSGIDEIDGYKNELQSQCEYNQEKYNNFVKSNAYEYIVSCIEDPNNLYPTTGSCMLPLNPWDGSNFDLFGGGYDMDNFKKETPSDFWFYNNNELVKRKSGNGFSIYMEDLNDTDITITEFPFVDLLGDRYGKYEASLFGNRYYYLQDDQRVKAFLFLNSLSKIYNYGNAIDSISINAETENYRSFIVMPIVCVLYAGGLLWLNRNKDKVVNIDKKGKKYHGFVDVKNLINNDKYEELDKYLRNDVKKQLIKYFEKWVTDGIESDASLPSFKSISDGLELDFSMGSEEFFKHIDETEEVRAIKILGKRTWFKKDPFYNSKGEHYKSLVDFLSGEIGDGLFKNYITIDEDVHRNDNNSTENWPLANTGSLRLGNRDNSPNVMKAVKLALAPCVFVKDTKFFNGNTKPQVSIDKGVLQNYLKGFIEEISSTIDGTNSVNNSISQADKTNTAEEIKIGVYRYCKLLYDKWIGGLSEKEFHDTWTMDRFFSTIDDRHDQYFHFIDGYYNKIGNEVIINMSEFMEQLYSSWQSSQLSLLSFLSSLYSKNKMMLLCVQNFLDLSSTSGMSKMFDTLAYTEHWNVKRNPNFLVVHPYEPSSHLELEGQEYENDGFMLNDFNNVSSWPEALKSKSVASSDNLRIPAFGVSYGKMYQSYFQNIDVSMDSPTVTEQSIRAQFEIASSMNEGESPDNRSKMATLGQDLFTIYSNNSYTCNVTMMGCAWIQPLMYFVLTNVPMFRGTYLIEKVTHHLEPGNMTTKFMGVRMAKTSNAIVRTSSIRDGSNISQVGSFGSVSERLEAERASTYNDCAYKIYPLSDDTAMDVDNLAATSDSNKNAMNSMAALVSMGYNKYAAAAIAGNIMTECGFQKRYIDNMVQANNNPGMKGGVCQWQGPRLVGLLKDEILNNADPIMSRVPMPCLGKQLKFIKLEIDNYRGYSSVKDALATATEENLDSVVRVFKEKYEVGTKLDERVKYAHELLEKYESENPTLPINQNPNDGVITDDNISENARFFINALNKTIRANGSEMVVDYDKGKSHDSTLYVVNTNRKTGLAKVFDIIVNGYTDVVSSVKWIAPSASYSSDPLMLEVIVSETPNKIMISMVSEDNLNNSLNIDVDVSGNEGGVNDSFLQSIVKRYKTSDNQQLKTEVPMLAGKNLDNMFERLKITNCKDVQYAYGSSSSSISSAEKPQELGPYTGSFNPYKFIEYLHKWQSCICEVFKENRKSYGGCNRCTGVVNRAIQNSGLGDKYSTKYPWQMYEKMKSSNEWVEVDSASSVSNKVDFNFRVNPKACDICLMWNPSDTSENFHACAYDGNRWISDFIQNSCNVYKSKRQFYLNWHLMRNRSQI